MKTIMLIQLLNIFLIFATKSATSKVNMTNLNKYLFSPYLIKDIIESRYNVGEQNS